MTKLTQGLIGDVVFHSALLGLNYYLNKEKAIRNYLISMTVIAALLAYLLPDYD